MKGRSFSIVARCFLELSILSLLPFIIFVNLLFSDIGHR